MPRSPIDVHPERLRLPETGSPGPSHRRPCLSARGLEGTADDRRVAGEPGRPEPMADDLTVAVGLIRLGRQPSNHGLAPSVVKTDDDTVEMKSRSDAVRRTHGRLAPSGRARNPGRASSPPDTARRTPTRAEFPTKVGTGGRCADRRRGSTRKSGKPNGSSSTVSTTLKIAVLAPIASARVAVVDAV